MLKTGMLSIFRPAGMSAFFFRTLFSPTTVVAIDGKVAFLRPAVADFCFRNRKHESAFRCGLAVVVFPAG